MPVETRLFLCRSDNYGVLLHDAESGATAAIDAPEAAPIPVPIVIAPRIAGSGRRLLDGLPSIQLESIRGSTSPSGHLLVDYRVIR